MYTTYSLYLVLARVVCVEGCLPPPRFNSASDLSPFLLSTNSGSGLPWVPFCTHSLLRGSTRWVSQDFSF
jgi:hypothetical protein